jgi:hypothetical protein
MVTSSHRLSQAQPSFVILRSSNEQPTLVEVSSPIEVLIEGINGGTSARTSNATELEKVSSISAMLVALAVACSAALMEQTPVNSLFLAQSFSRLPKVTCTGSLCAREQRGTPFLKHPRSRLPTRSCGWGALPAGAPAPKLPIWQPAERAHRTFV